MSRNHPSRENNARWRRLRARLFDAENWRCRSCGKAGGRLELDHVQPLEHDGDRWDPDNLQPLCRPCHFSKTAKERQARRGPPTAWQRLVASRLEVVTK